MNELRRLLVGVDLHARTCEPDDGGLKAAQQATWVAARTGAEVVLLHSTWDEREEQSTPPTRDQKDQLEMLRAAAEGSGARCSIEITEDRAWLALVERAVGRQADLVLAGKRAVAGREERRVGSTAVKLLRKCPAPVWLVKPDHDLQHRLVLAATDLSPVALRALEAGAWIVEQSSGELHALHAWRLSREILARSSDLPEQEYAALVDARRAAAQSALEHAVDGLPVDPTLHLERGPAFREILTTVESLQPDLLVMGSLSTGGRPGFLVGTTAERVLERVDCSLLMFKPGEFVSPIAVAVTDTGRPLPQES